MPNFTSRGQMQPSRSTAQSAMVQSPLVQARLKDYRPIGLPGDFRTADHARIVPACDLGPPGREVRWVFSFDGSPQEVIVEPRFPSVRVGYLQVAAVLTDLHKLRDASDARFVDPKAVRDSINPGPLPFVLPGSNNRRGDCESVRDSWRHDIYDGFGAYSIEGRTFLQVYMDLVRHGEKGAGSGVSVANCPGYVQGVADDDADGWAECPRKDQRVPAAGAECPTCHYQIFPTDALRIHEEVNEEQPNLTALGRLMSCTEHLLMAGYVDRLRRRAKTALPVAAFVIDGPLAMFGPQAWLKESLGNFLHAPGPQPLVFGVEKTGSFAEHAAAIREQIPAGSVMGMSDDYIFRHVKAGRRRPGAAYGRDTYYGRHFIYKTMRGQMLCITIPHPEPKPDDPSDPTAYPTLPAALALLERVGTLLYQDGLIPVTLAHHFASLPLRTGTKVLELLAKGELPAST